MTLIFLEDADPRGYNEGSWVIQWNLGANPQSFAWVDPPAMYHVNQDTTGFADGHAKGHRWMDPSIIKAGQQAAAGVQSFNFVGPTKGPDYNYIRQIYRFPGWKDY